MGITLKILIVTLFFNAVEARPISYSGGHTIMHFNDNMKESLYYHYSPSYKYSFGIENLNDKVFSKIIIRGLGVTDSQNQVDNLINWFGIMAKSVNKLIKTQESRN